MMNETETVHIDNLYTLAQGFIGRLEARADTRERATVVALSGELGLGKTAFTKACATALGITQTVRSPTFVIQKSYQLTERAEHAERAERAERVFRYFIHIDAYRLHSGEELRALGWEALLADPNNLIFIEWPEHVEDIVPDAHIRVTFAHVDESTREITITDTGSANT